MSGAVRHKGLTKDYLFNSIINLPSLRQQRQIVDQLNAAFEKIDKAVAALDLMLSTSSNVVALAKKMAKAEKKIVTRTVAVPKTKIVKQKPQQQTTPKDTEQTDFTPIRPQPPLPNQQDDREKR